MFCSRLHYAVLTVVIIAKFLVPMDVHALPLLGPKYPVELDFRGDDARKKKFSAFIKKQQSENAQLKALEDGDRSQAQIARYGNLLTQLLQKYVRSLGFYSANIAVMRKDALSEPKSIPLRVTLGQRTMIKKIAIEAPGFFSTQEKQALELIAKSDEFDLDKPLLASVVVAAQDRLKRYLDERYCFIAPKLRQKVSVVRRRHIAEVKFVLDAGPEQTIESIHFEGAPSLSEYFLRNSISLKPGCYKASAVGKAQVDLLQTGLLSGAVPKTEQLTQNTVKLTFHLQERKHKTQRVGLGFASEEGVRLTLGWEHRNWRGNGKNLSADFLISQLNTQVGTALRVPQFKTPKLSLLLQSELVQTKADAFDSTSARVSALLEYEASRHWRFSTGLTSQYSRVDSSTGSDIFRLVSVPSNMQWDKSDNLLDPTKGFTWAFAVEPFIDLADTQIRFTRWSTSYKQYYSPQWAMGLEQRKRLTFASRIAAGTISGEPLGTVPADQRYYAGGGGSVRGFDFQSLSPRAEEAGELTVSDPTAIVGGLAFLEAAVEARIRFTEQWGAGLFVDAGRAFAQSSPDFGAPLSIGAGFGLRYMTSFAPIRVDFAWPVDSPYTIDNGLQLYVGLKQAF